MDAPNVGKNDGRKLSEAAGSAEADPVGAVLAVVLAVAVAAGAVAVGDASMEEGFWDGFWFTGRDI